MSNRQAQFESFLAAQQKRHQEVWFKFLPSILRSLADAVVQTKSSVYKNNDLIHRFEGRSLIVLRQLYGEIKELASGEHSYDNYKRSQQLVSDMISQINSWYRTTKVAVGIKETLNPKYTGKAAIAERFDVMISDNFDVTLNRLNRSF